MFAAVAQNGQPIHYRLTVGIVTVLLLAGCSRTEHRLNADRESYSTIAERNVDPRWAAVSYSIEPDARSRFFDPYDPDCPPMPLDDPASHQYMHCVDGMKGWKHWHDNGIRGSLENPGWWQHLNEYTDLTADGEVRLNVDSALRLAYMHSPVHQAQLETLYLSALAVTGERFRLDTQFFAGTGTRWRHRGALQPVGIVFNPFLNDYQLAGPFDVPESNRLDVDVDVAATKRLATGGEVLAGFANSFLFEFSGGDVNLVGSLANFSFIQPLLRGAGRDVALEDLTQAERNLLANLRAYSQFRQGLFTDVLIGESGVSGPQLRSFDTNLQSFSGFGGVNGYLGLLQQAQQIRNTEDNLRLQLRTRDRLEALYNNDLIDIVQLDQFRQNIESTRANLLDQTNGLELAVDNYKTLTLGLPAALPLDIDEALIEPFQLIPAESNPVLEALLGIQLRIGDIGELLNLTVRVRQLDGQLSPPPADPFDAELTLERLRATAVSVSRRILQLPEDLAAVQGDPELWSTLSPQQQADVKQLAERLTAGELFLQDKFVAAAERLENLLDDSEPASLAPWMQRNSDWLNEILSLSNGVVIVQRTARNIDEEPAAVLESSAELIAPVQQLFELAEQDLARLEQIAAVREALMPEDQQALFLKDRERLRDRLIELKTGERGFDVAVAQLNSLRSQSGITPRPLIVRQLTAWIQNYVQLSERLALVPAQARLEIITVENVQLEPERAFQIALANRLDFMNGRAALVDQWRQIQVAADALQSNLTITGNGSVQTGNNNLTDFRAATSAVNLGVRFDAPLARLLERNGYRATLIQYQRSRRDLIRSHDNLQKGLRALLRTLEQRRLQLEIQRRAVSIALRRVDQTQLNLLTPPAQGQPGVRPQINPTTAINLLSAQGSLQSSQNSFLSAWLNYYAARVRLYRELGIMQLDGSGKWVELPIDIVNEPLLEPFPPGELPPAIPIRLTHVEPHSDADQGSDRKPEMSDSNAASLPLTDLLTSQNDAAQNGAESESEGSDDEASATERRHRSFATKAESHGKVPHASRPVAVETGVAESPADSAESEESNLLQPVSATNRWQKIIQQLQFVPQRNKQPAEH